MTAVIRDMIRESGDRGASILNYLTDLCLFMAAMSIMLEGEKLFTAARTSILNKCLRNEYLAELLAEMMALNCSCHRSSSASGQSARLQANGEFRV